MSTFFHVVIHELLIITRIIATLAEILGHNYFWIVHLLLTEEINRKFKNVLRLDFQPKLPSSHHRLHLGTVLAHRIFSNVFGTKQSLILI